MDAHVIQQYIGCLGQPYADGTVRSRRDMFGVCLDRPKGMLDMMVGQTVAAPRREQRALDPRDTKSIVDIPTTGHLSHFVTKT